MAQMDYVEEVTVTKADIDSFHDMLDSQSETIKDAILDVFGNDTDGLSVIIKHAVTPLRHFRHISSCQEIYESILF